MNDRRGCSVAYFLVIFVILSESDIFIRSRRNPWSAFSVFLRIFFAKLGDLSSVRLDCIKSELLDVIIIDLNDKNFSLEGLFILKPLYQPH